MPKGQTAKARHDVIVDGGELFGGVPLGIDVDRGQGQVFLRFSTEITEVGLTKEQAALLRDHLSIKLKNLGQQAST